MQKPMKYMNIYRKIRLFYRGVTVGSGPTVQRPGSPEAATRPYKVALEPLQGPEHRLLGRVVLDTTEDGGFCKIQKMNVAALKN